jgi:hypothetical protein
MMVYKKFVKSISADVLNNNLTCLSANGIGSRHTGLIQMDDDYIKRMGDLAQTSKQYFQPFEMTKNGGLGVKNAARFSRSPLDNFEVNKIPSQLRKITL